MGHQMETLYVRWLRWRDIVAQLGQLRSSRAFTQMSAYSRLCDELGPEGLGLKPGDQRLRLATLLSQAEDRMYFGCLYAQLLLMALGFRGRWLEMCPLPMDRLECFRRALGDFRPLGEVPIEE
jgi:hypothetical protein